MMLSCSNRQAELKPFLTLFAIAFSLCTAQYHALSAFLPHGCTSSVPMIRHQNTRRVRIVEVRRSSSTSIQRKIATTNIIEHAAATSILIIPALVGSSMERFLKHIPILNKLQGIGIPVTIMSASILSSLVKIPAMQSIHELCWSVLLPASLSLWLVASTIEEENRDSFPGDDVMDEVFAVSIPFFIGCIGSALGCLLSFAYCCVGRNNATRTHKLILSGRQHFFLRPGHLLLSPAEAAVAAGCLCSAFIGGPWNYFASMRILENDESLPSFARDAVRGVLGSTFGSSASDMLLMPIYFSALQSLILSKRIGRLFPGRCMHNEDGSCNLENSLDDNANHFYGKRIKRAHLFLISVTIGPIIWAIVRISDAFESRIGIAGIGIAINSLLSCIVPAAASQLCRLFEDGKYRSLIAFEVRQITTKMSDICFYMLLSVIGVTTNFRTDILDGGWTPSSSFIFAASSLFIHFVVIVFGSLGVMRLFPRWRQFPLRPEEIAVASCAAIIGPQASSSLAVKMSTDNRNNVPTTTFLNWRGLMLSGTVFGVLGYVIGCPVGVLLSRRLLRFLEHLKG